jgi:dolichol-phosphate mannosyltransferase
MNSLEISLVVPLFNEEEVVHETHTRLVNVMKSCGLGYEIIYVNDGSRDNTAAIIRDFCRQDSRTKMIGRLTVENRK